MKQNAELIKSCNLYLILDTSVLNFSDLFDVAENVVASGGVILQLRDKLRQEEEMIRFSKELNRMVNGKVPYFINDYIDLVDACEASGVHLGQEDKIKEGIIRMQDKRLMAGVSCQNIDQLREAELLGADYIGFGSVFKTLTKPDRSSMDLNLLRQAAEVSTIPIFAIGGIAVENIDTVLDCGISQIAVTREILLAEDVQLVVKSLKDKCHSFSSKNIIDSARMTTL